MTRKEFSEIKCIALEIKARGQLEVIEETPIAIAAPFEGVTIVRPNVQTPTTPYATIAQVQPIRIHHDQ